MLNLSLLSFPVAFHSWTLPFAMATASSVWISRRTPAAQEAWPWIAHRMRFSTGKSIELVGPEDSRPSLFRTPAGPKPILQGQSL